MRWGAKALVTAAILVPSGILAAAAAAALALAGIWVEVSRRRAVPALVRVLNLPLDLLAGTLGWFLWLCGLPLYSGTRQNPSAAWYGGCSVLIGGPGGQAVATFAGAFTPSSTIVISAPVWEGLSAAGRDRLLNHELWHARNQFGRYGGWVFWPAYLLSNLVFGVHERNPFESGRAGAYTMVDHRWESGYRESRSYVAAASARWLRR